MFLVELHEFVGHAPHDGMDSTNRTRVIPNVSRHARHDLLDRLTLNVMLETDRRPEQAKRTSGKYQFSAGTAFRCSGLHMADVRAGTITAFMPSKTPAGPHSLRSCAWNRCRGIRPRML
jgi:hypothetical protein